MQELPSAACERPAVLVSHYEVSRYDVGTNMQCCVLFDIAVAVSAACRALQMTVTCCDLHSLAMSLCQHREALSGAMLTPGVPRERLRLAGPVQEATGHRPAT